MREEKRPSYESGLLVPSDKISIQKDWSSKQNVLDHVTEKSRSRTSFSDSCMEELKMAPSILMVQWDPWRLWSAGMRVQSPAWHSGLRILCCIGHNCSSDLIPAGNSMSLGGKKKKKNKKIKNLNSISSGLVSFSGSLAPHEARWYQRPTSLPLANPMERQSLCLMFQTRISLNSVWFKWLLPTNDCIQGMGWSDRPGLVMCSSKSVVGGVSPTWTREAERRELILPTKSGVPHQKEEQVLSYWKQSLSPTAGSWYFSSTYATIS